MIKKSNLLHRALVLVMLVGVNGGIFGNDDSSIQNQEDPAATHFVTIMNKQLKKESHSQQSKRYQKLSPGYLLTHKQVQNFVFRKFKAEMWYMFSFLPEKKRCNIVVSLAVATTCNLTAVIDILHNESIVKKRFKCYSRKTLQYAQCGTKDSKRVLAGFWNKMGKLFNNISVPFQCNIINRIATTSLRYRRQKQHGNSEVKTPRITLQTAEQQIEIIFPYLNIKEKCSKIWKPLKKLVPLQSPASLVNLTITLDPGIKRKTWLRNLKRKSYQIYKIYYNNHYQSKKERPLILKHRRPSNPPLLHNNNVKLNIVRVTKANSLVSVVFGVEIKKPRMYVYRKISPAKLLIGALKKLGRRALNSLFNATVVKLDGAQQETSQVKYIWSEPQIRATKQQFPHYLVAYYRKLDRLGKCLVMLYISSSLRMNLRPVEMLYNAFKYVPRKYFCSSKRRIPVRHPLVNITKIYIGKHKIKRVKSTSSPKHELNTTNIDKALVTARPKHSTNTGMEVGNFPDVHEEPEENKITPLEIGLFAILALLCLAILAFLVNCILFTIKKKKSAQPQQVNTAFSRAIFRKDTNSTLAEDPHIHHVKVTLINELNSVVNSPRFYHTEAPEQWPHNNTSLREIPLSKEMNSLNSQSSSNKEDESTEDVVFKNKSDDRTDLSDSEDNYSEKCNHSERTNSQSQSIHNSRNTLSFSINELHLEQCQRTLKECTGELEIISPDDNDFARSTSCRSVSDPCLKNSPKKLFVHLY